MSRIFISYKRVDKERVFDLKKLIETHTGEKCWIDIDGIESDAQFKNVIINAIRDCEIFLFMYSGAHSKIVDFEKDWTIRELNFASSKNKRIVFVNIDKSPLTDEFIFDYGTKQQIDGTSTAAIDKLITDLIKWLSLALQKDNSAKNFTTPTSRPLTMQSIHNTIEGQTICAEVPKTKSDISKNILLKSRKKNILINISIILTIIITIIVVSIFCLKTHPTQITNNLSDAGKTVNMGNERLSAVDLGLPSGKLWGNMNIGASSQSDYGNRFAWGESKNKSDYTKRNYQVPNYKNLSDTQYDIAHSSLGPGWSMPTENDFQELINNCTWIWTSVNNRMGYKIIGTNGNHIFLPAAGWAHDGSTEYQNLYGYYWTSDKANDTFAKGLLFSNTEIKTGNGYLYYGRCVRPIYYARSIVAQ